MFSLDIHTLPRVISLSSLQTRLPVPRKGALGFSEQAGYLLFVLMKWSQISVSASVFLQTLSTIGGCLILNICPRDGGTIYFQFCRQCFSYNDYLVVKDIPISVINEDFRITSSIWCKVFYCDMLFFSNGGIAARPYQRIRNGVCARRGHCHPLLFLPNITLPLRRNCSAPLQFCSSRHRHD